MTSSVKAIIAIILLLPNESLISTQIVNENYLHEIQRRAKAADIGNYIDAGIDPCQNFYNYACGKWLKINPAIKVTKTGFVSILRDNYEKKLKKFLNAPKSSNDSSIERKVKYFYDSCINEFKRPHSSRQQLIDLMEEFGGMPALKAQNWQAGNFNWLNVSAEILRKYNKQILISVHILPDLRNNRRARLYVGFPHKQNFQLVDFEELRSKIEKDLKNVLGVNKMTAVKAATEIAKFQLNFSETVENTLRKIQPRENWPLRLINDMSDEYGPHLDLNLFIRNWLGHDYLLPVYEPTNLYHENLKILIEATPKPVLANFMMWRLVEDFQCDLETSLEKQQQKCLLLTENHFMKFLNHKVYQTMIESCPALTKDTLKLFQELKATLSRLILNSDVLGNNLETRKIKEKMLHKLEGMTLEILNNESTNFELEYGQISISSENLFQNLLSIHSHMGSKFQQRLFNISKLHRSGLNVSPAYIPEQNKIRLPVAFLAPHYRWNSAYPAALKYAMIGHAIAHEMAHGFDAIGSRFDADGDFLPWWEQLLIGQLFFANEFCLRDHYRTFNFKRNHQAENFADLLALKIAFEAYLTWLNVQMDQAVLKEEFLPYLRLTPKKLFFVATAQFWCTALNKNVDSSFWHEDDHAPEEVRVNAMMSSLPQFASEFKCELNNTMNPQNKCVLL